MKRSLWIYTFVIMSLYGFLLSPLYAQQGKVEVFHQDNWEEVTGKVESLSLESSIMVVKVFLDEGKSTYQESTISVMKEAEILREGKVLALKDLKIGDNIAVRYILAAGGQKQAYFIWLK